MFTFQTTSKFYQKKNSQKDGLVGSITLTHFIENLPEWNIELEDEFEKRRDGSESGKCAYTFHDYLLDCLEDDILTDLQAVGKFCKEMEYVFETSYDFRR